MLGGGDGFGVAVELAENGGEVGMVLDVGGVEFDGLVKEGDRGVVAAGLEVDYAQKLDDVGLVGRYAEDLGAKGFGAGEIAGLKGGDGGIERFLESHDRRSLKSEERRVKSEKRERPSDVMGLGIWSCVVACGGAK